VVFIEKENKKIFTADGMVTFKKGVSLCILHADCQCAFYFDPVNLQLGAVHAGFRGLLNGIHENTIDLFLKNGSKVENIYVYVGPSLGLDHAEFINYKTEFPLQFHKYNNQNNHFDLKLIAKDLMLQKGIPKSNIEISPVCSFSDSSIFSYRRANKTNSFDKDYRNFSFIGLK
jgi:hypothetical protein